MKNKWAVVVAILMNVGMVYAACVGPYCYDDTGAQVPTSTNPQGVTLISTNSVISLTPSAKGQLIFCDECGSSGSHGLCVSTGTGVGAWVEVSASSGLVRCVD